jgi:diaminopropionate ammonia-lyase
MTIDLYLNPRSATRAASPLSAAGFDAARAEIQSWPGYAPTPLRELPGLAAALGIGRLWYKDEGPRFGLGSFKALGGAYAVLRVVQRAVELRTGERTGSAGLVAGRHREIAREVTVTAATDGNHGRAVAWGARLFHCRCVIFVHPGVSRGRRAAIARFGAEVVEVPGTYDDSVRHAAAEAARHGWTVVSDTSWPGYDEIPRDVMHGYGVLADEVAAQLAPGERPSHVLLHAGVGAFAASVMARLAQLWPGERESERSRFVVVEPEKAACCLASIRAGRPVALAGDVDTVMAGLACGEMSPLAFPILAGGAEAFVAIEEKWAPAAVRRLAEPARGDPPVVAGETGAAGVAALLAVAEDRAAREALGLDAGARVLVFGSEGATDPEIYRAIVGRDAAEVGRAQDEPGSSGTGSAGSDGG